MKKGKQKALPGLEARDVPEIEQAADHYRQIRDERYELSTQEAEAKSALIQVMKNLGRSFYQYNGLKVQLETTDNVRVKSSEGDDDEPSGNFKQTRRKVKDTAERWIEQAEELIERQQAEQASKEAVNDFFQDKEAVEGFFEAIEDLCEEKKQRDMNPWPYEGDDEEEDQGAFNPRFPPGFDPDQASEGLRQRRPFILISPEAEGQSGESAKDDDDFTAPRCDECGRIDGAHAKECSKSNTLRFEDYEAYARAHYKRNWSSYARKMHLRAEPDVATKVRKWLEEQQQQATVTGK